MPFKQSSSCKKIKTSLLIRAYIGSIRRSLMDEDLQNLTREELIAEVLRLRAGIRQHRDSSGHNLCWHHPDLWGLLPESISIEIAVPPWPKFMAGCVAYRRSLDAELPDAPVGDVEYTER